MGGLSRQVSKAETPPRAWGRQKNGRIFYAWAEKHPHVHGEDTWADYLDKIKVETPPRAWGRPSLGGFVAERDGNTPTCMGKTYRLPPSPPCSKKHPHVHGEDRAGVCRVNPFVETPPRAWGRLRWKYHQSFCIGNTPTCMGKTFSVISYIWYSRKHPHVHGEDSQ